MTPEALQQLLPALRPQLVDLATRYLQDRAEAEDVVQDAMLKLWLLRQHMIGNVEAFARVMVRNMALNRLRRRRRQMPLGDLAQMETALQAEASEAEAAAVSADDVARLLSIIDTLPDRQRTILRLHDLEGMSYDDLSQLTGMAPATLRQAVSRSRRQVRLRYLAAISAAVAVLLVVTWGYGVMQYHRLERRYEGSYVVEAGQRNDNLREIRPQLELALAQAETLEGAIDQGRDVVRQAEADVLESIADPDERRRLEQLLAE